MKKRFNVLLYTKDGTYIRTVKPELLKVIPNTNEKTNLGQGSATFDFGVKFDEYFLKLGLDFMVRIEVIQYDKNNVDGLTIFSGVIQQVRPILRASNNGVGVTAYGYGALLSRSKYLDGSRANITYTTTEPKTILENIISNFNAKTFDSIIWDSSLVETVGTNISFEFDKNTWFEAIENVRELSGGGYFWGVGPDRKFYFKHKSSEPDHKFHLSKDVQSLDNLIRIDGQIQNYVRVYYDTFANYEDYFDQTSIDDFGEVYEEYEVSDIKDSTTALQLATEKVTENKDPKFAVKLTINNGYDLTSIKIGDTCKVLGTKIGSKVFKDNMQIVAISYEVDSIKLTLETLRNNFTSAILGVNSLNK